jgi:hypothetical protein
MSRQIGDGKIDGRKENMLRYRQSVMLMVVVAAGAEPVKTFETSSQDFFCASV